MCRTVSYEMLSLLSVLQLWVLVAQLNCSVSIHELSRYMLSGSSDKKLRHGLPNKNYSSERPTFVTLSFMGGDAVRGTLCPKQANDKS